jgi:hypothetical protein
MREIFQPSDSASYARECSAAFTWQEAGERGQTDAAHRVSQQFAARDLKAEFGLEMIHVVFQERLLLRQRFVEIQHDVDTSGQCGEACLVKLAIPGGIADGQELLRFIRRLLKLAFETLEAFRQDR